MSMMNQKANEANEAKNVVKSPIIELKETCKEEVFE